MHLFYIGKCPTKACKHAERHPWEVNATTFGQCPEHGTYKLKVGAGYHADVKCGARCTGATGPSCDCSCGGVNHGIAHAA